MYVDAPEAATPVPSVSNPHAIRFALCPGEHAQARTTALTDEYPAAMFSPSGNESNPEREARSPSPEKPSEEAWEKVLEAAMSLEWNAAAEARAFEGDEAEEEGEEEAFFKDDDDDGEEETWNDRAPLLGERAEALQAE